MLGLTIFDNGAGYAFIKKIRDDSIMASTGIVKVGDHLCMINGTDLTGTRHFEVARMLKEIPIGSEFSVNVTHPNLAADTALAPRGAQGGSGDVKAGGGKKTMRMKKDGTAVVEVIDDTVVLMCGKVDDMLDQFVGIRDIELSNTIYDLAKASKEADFFAGALDEKIADFEFPDDFVLLVYDMINVE